MIYGLVFSSEKSDSDSGSADKTAKRYDRVGKSEEVFQHPDFVKDIIAVDGFVYTACSDENIRQWSLEVRSWDRKLIVDNESESSL
jgi:hypothetical protein